MDGDDIKWRNESMPRFPKAAIRFSVLKASDEK